MKEMSRRSGRWTVERDAYLTREYPKNTPMQELLATLSAMEGDPITGIHIQDRALKVLRVYRSGRLRPGPPTPIIIDNEPWRQHQFPPPAKMTKDGVPSAAWLSSKVPDDSVPASMADIQLWASQHGRSALDAMDLVAAVNEIRIGFGLPPFRPVQMRQPRLPPAWFGSDGKRSGKEKSPSGDIGD